MHLKGNAIYYNKPPVSTAETFEKHLFKASSRNLVIMKLLSLCLFVRSCSPCFVWTLHSSVCIDLSEAPLHVDILLCIYVNVWLISVELKLLL